MEYDAVVVGGGPGGYVAAIRLRQLGLKTCCIEKDPQLGGACLTVACIPSKTLLHSSELYQRFKEHAISHGISIEYHAYDFPSMMSKKTEVISGLSDAMHALFKKHGVDLIIGSAKLVDAHTVVVTKESGGQTAIQAKSIVLATGSKPIAFPFMPFDEKKILSSSGALSLNTLPKKMVVVGGGAVGVELASVYSRLGTEVTVIELLPSLCMGIDKSLTNALLPILEQQNITFVTNTQVLAMKDRGDKGVEVWARPPSGEELSFQGDVVLVAIGRSPNFQNLGLSELNIDVTGRNTIVVDSRYRTTVPSVYAIGDLIDGPHLAHRASCEGMAVAEIIAGKGYKLNYKTIPNVIYTNPEVATVGLSEQEAQEFGQAIKIGMCPFKVNPRAQTQEDVTGFVKIVADGQTDRLLGMHIIATHASEMIGIGSLAIQKRATCTELADLAFAHPTYSEAIKEACLQAIGRGFYTQTK